MRTAESRFPGLTSRCAVRSYLRAFLKFHIWKPKPNSNNKNGGLIAKNPRGLVVAPATRLNIQLEANRRWVAMEMPLIYFLLKLRM